MPSCVVKNCKNNSTDAKKYTGITFHRFPKDMNWKFKWIQAIRACRDDDSWLPSKFSVVCSTHFAEDDIFYTQCGRRRIADNAVPQLKLYDIVPKKKKVRVTKVKTFNVSVQTGHVGPSDDGTVDSDTITGDRVEPTGDRIENISIKVEPTEMTEGTAEIETQTNEVPNVIVKVEHLESAEGSSSIEVSVDPLDPKNDVDIIAISSHYEKERKSNNEKLKICETKIKILHQKLRRYQRRNLKLKNILKEMRCKKLIDKDIFRQLTTALANK